MSPTHDEARVTGDGNSLPVSVAIFDSSKLVINYNPAFRQTSRRALRRRPHTRAKDKIRFFNLLLFSASLRLCVEKLISQF